MKLSFKVCMLLVLLSISSYSMASGSLSYSGRLVNNAGTAVTGPVTLTVDFAYTNSTGVIRCTETITNVALTNGVFHLKMTPDCTPSTLASVLEAIPVNEALAIRVTDDTHSKTYSFQAIHSLPSSYISETSKQLVQLGAVAGQVLQWDGTKWAPANSASGSVLSNSVSANNGTFSIGSTATSFDGTTAGSFVGDVNGTQLAINAPSGYTGNLMDAQVNGASVFSIGPAGTIVSANITTGYVLSDTIEATNTLISASNGVTGYTGAGLAATPANVGGKLVTENYSWSDGAMTNWQMKVSNTMGVGQYAYIGAVANNGAVYSPEIVFGARTGAASYGEWMRIDQSGNVGIGITLPGYKLDVQGGGVNASGGYTSVSDKRLKEKIKPLKNSLEKLLLLNPVSYLWKDKTADDSLQVGFIAQEVETVFPEFVKINKKGLRSLNYSQMVSPLVKGTQELHDKWYKDHKEIEELKSTAKALKEENLRLRAANEKILERLERLEKGRSLASKK